MMNGIKIKFLMVFMLIASLTYSQQDQSSMTNLEVVEKFFEGFNDPTKIPESLALLAEDYQFSNPIVQLHSKAEFIALAQEIGKVVHGIKVISLAENGDWVATFYEFHSSVPGLESNRASEWFRIENGLIKESKMIYDASEWRKVYAQMEK